MGELSRAEFGDIVGAIYDCAIDPSRWAPTLERIRGWMDGGAVALMVRDMVRAQPKIEVGVGTEPYWANLQVERYGQIAPFIAPMTYLKAGQVVSVEDVMDYDVYLQGRFHKEWAAPQGLADAVLGVLAQTGSRVGAIGVSLRSRATDKDRQAMTDLLPHVIRAVAISDLLEFRAAKVAQLSAAVDGLVTGVVFVAADLNVLDFNAAADRIVRERKIVAIENGRLLLPNSDVGRRLRTAITICAEGQLDELKTSTVVFEGRDGGPGLVAHVLPLSRSDSSSPGSAVAVVFLTDPEASVRMPIETLVEQYGLSPSELRVLMGLMQGQTPSDIADAHGIAMPTIRTHLRHLFHKTGTSGQMQLVKLAMSMMQPQTLSGDVAKLS